MPAVSGGVLPRYVAGSWIPCVGRAGGSWHWHAQALAELSSLAELSLAELRQGPSRRGCCGCWVKMCIPRSCLKTGIYIEVASQSVLQGWRGQASASPR